ncbi:MAG TPA: helix-turn-helix transcriptional regulator [Pseudonocardiaceae bacterium]|nr:helix-turn-helix transcriptional regulator [Pseudonocardiaceae bacterium]
MSTEAGVTGGEEAGMIRMQDPTVQRHRLRDELRRARDAADLRQADVAHAMEWSASKLIRIERGDVSISTNDLKALLSYYGVRDKGKINGLLELARSARRASFYEQYSDQMKAGFKEYLAYEASAAVTRQYQPVLIPGLLQTEEYARGLFAGYHRDDPDAADKGWAVREHRQQVHEWGRPPEMLFVLDEAALRRPVGRAHTMLKQLARLKEFAAKPHISIQIMPFARGAHPGLEGSFILLEFADPNLPNLLYRDGTVIRDNQIERYTERFVRLQEMALSLDESVEFLNVLIEEMTSSANLANGAEKEAT